MRKINLNTIEVNAILVSQFENKQGDSLSDIRKIDRVCDVLETVIVEDKEQSKDVLLEDADFTFMEARFNAFVGWNAQARKLIIKIADKIKSAEKVEIKEESKVKKSTK